MVFCLGRGADLHKAQLMMLPLTVFCSSKSRFVHLSGAGLPRLLNGCSVVVAAAAAAAVGVAVAIVTIVITQQLNVITM